MNRRPRQRGFTLVELLVVIAIIVVLMAILFPVFNVVRRRARETQCKSNLAQLASAMKSYRRDHGRFPGRPYYDAAAQRYCGGFSDLYPDYIDSTKLLICPEDRDIRPVQGQARDKAYCSYNGLATNPVGDQWDLQEVHYNYNGYDIVPAGGAYNSTGLDMGPDPTYETVLMLEYSSKGLRLRNAPRLSNRSAPNNTIITHCVRHRRTSKAEENKRDFVLRLDGSVNDVKHVQFDEDPDGGGAKIAPWISQLD